MPGQCNAIIRSNAGILLIVPSRTFLSQPQWVNVSWFYLFPFLVISLSTVFAYCNWCQWGNPEWYGEIHGNTGNIGEMHRNTSNSMRSNASVTSNYGPPYDFYHPYDFLPVRPSEVPIGILCRCCSRGHIRLRAPYHLIWLYTYGLVEWLAGLHGYPVRCPYRLCTGSTRESSVFFIPYRTRTGPGRTCKGAVPHPYGHVKELLQPKLTKIPHGPHIWPHGALRARYGPPIAVHRLFRISKPVRGP